MPVQSRLSIAPPPTSRAVVPYNAVNNPCILQGILESSFLTLMLKHHHIHSILEIHNYYVLDFNLASGIWCVLKDLS